MSADTLSPDDEKLLQAAAKVVSGGSRVSGEVLSEWMHSDCPQVRARATEILVTRRHLVDDVPADADAFCISTLKSFAFRDRRDNDDLPNRWEAANLLAVLFNYLWARRPASRGALARLKHTFAKLIKTGETMKETVLLGALEHLWPERDKADYFKDWRSDPRLAPVYAEGLELAEGWRHLKHRHRQR